MFAMCVLKAVVAGELGEGNRTLIANLWFSLFFFIIPKNNNNNLYASVLTQFEHD
jgi:hypothetical protein